MGIIGLFGTWDTETKRVEITLTKLRKEKENIENGATTLTN